MKKNRSYEKKCRLNRNLFIYHHGKQEFDLMISGMKKVTAIMKLIPSANNWNTVETYNYLTEY